MPRKPTTAELLRADVESGRGLRRAPFYLWLERNPLAAAALAPKPGKKRNWVFITDRLVSNEGMKDGKGRPLNPKQARNTFWRFWDDQKKAGKDGEILALLDANAQWARPLPEVSSPVPKPTTSRRRFRTAGENGTDA